MELSAKISKCRFEGFIVRPDGTRRDIGSHTNLVLDQGLLRLLSTQGGSSVFHIGTGNAPVERTQTTLANAHSTFTMATSSGTTTTGTDEIGQYVEWSCVGQTPTFGSAANIAEFGFGWGAEANALMSRALTRNSEGTPTAISILAGEILVLTYYFRLYMPTGTLSGTMTVNTNGEPATHNWTSTPRAGQILALGVPSGLSLVSLISSIQIGGASRAFQLGSAQVTANGASILTYWSKVGNTGNLTINGIFSVAANERSLPINITISPPYSVTNDQRAVIGFTQYLVQDYG